jgi:hypothetical protein
MISAYKLYRQYIDRGYTSDMAWRMSGAERAAKKLQSILAAMIVAAVWIWAISEHADAAEVDMDKSYVSYLEKLAATCIQDGLHEVWIGDEQYLCGSYKTGVKR